MTELVDNPIERSNDATACIISLLHHYGFDLGGHTISQLLLGWQEHYPTAWIRLATIEALYQGRYKAISVEQILAMWQRRSQPLYHFNHEFERLVCKNLPENLVLSDPSPQSEPLAPRSTTIETKLTYHSVALQLPSFRGTALPEAAVMLALRTLHSVEMAALTEDGLTEDGLTGVQAPAEEGTQAPTQIYSYKLRSDESPSSTAPLESSETPVQSEVDQTVISSEEVATDASEASDGTLQDEPLIPKSHQAEDKQPLAAHESTAALAPLQVGSIAKILQQLEHQELNIKPMFPMMGLVATAPTLKPKLQLHLTTHYQPIWLTAASSKQPIHQFTPTPELPDFYSKLKVATQPPDDPEDSASSQ
ncbi:MAG: hypothetical protein H7Z11_19885 [Verrucomicrobia bacterium]|nr:hypothetical protein [Leptolyngbya sp. ES-bin-22]